MVFNAVFNTSSVYYMAVASACIHTFLEFFFKPVIRIIFLPSPWLLSHITTVETNGQRQERNESCRNDIINPRNEYLAEPGIEPATSYFQVLYATDLAKGVASTDKNQSVEDAGVTFVKGTTSMNL